MAKDKWGCCARAGMDVLVEHWEDPRSEEALAEIAKGEPKYIREGFKTLHGEAYERLLLVQARKIRRDLLKDKQTDKEKLAAIREFWDRHPDWLTPATRPRDKTFLVGELIGEAMKVGGGDAVDLLVRAGFRGGLHDGMAVSDYDAYLKKHMGRIIEYARSLGCEKALGSPNLLNALLRVKEEYATVLPLLEGWLKELKDDQKFLIDELVPAVSGGSQGMQRLLGLLEDPRPNVVRRAARWLSVHFPGEKALAGVKAALERRKAAGASAEELREFEWQVKAIEEEIAGRKGPHPPPN